MEFELQYELDEFKEIQDQYFDEDGKCYTGINISTDIMEKMLSLIDNLSERENYEKRNRDQKFDSQRRNGYPVGRFGRIS